MALALVRHWWLLGARGVIALVFGVTAFIWPDITLGTFVLLFGAYAVVDGVVAIASAFGAAEHLTQSWPVLLEGLVSVAVGTLAWVWPHISLRALFTMAVWGLVTGALELGAAMTLRLDVTTRWLFALAGGASLVLGAFLLLLPAAGTHAVVDALGVYAVLFGMLVLIASLRLRRRRDVRGETVRAWRTIEPVGRIR
jgi:uncharacterized membrane protein HdeD (DUF308 family)